MLEVTVLKVMHARESEAQKLLPYILECDVYSPENAFASAKRATTIEKNWKEIISSGMSRAKFNRYYNAILTGYGSRETQAFLNKRMDYLFRNKKPIYHLERWEDEEKTQYLDRESDDVLFQIANGFKLIKQGNVELGLRQVYEAQLKTEKFCLGRDKATASHLESAEKEIRLCYPELAVKNSIKYLVEIGFSHMIEKYATIPTKVISLSGGSDDPFQAQQTIFIEALRAGKTLEETKPLILRLAEFG